MTTKKSVVTDEMLNGVPVEAPLETINIPDFTYKKIWGYYGAIKRKDDKIESMDWEGCRDRFQTNTDPEQVMDFLFYVNDDTKSYVVSFMRTIEKTINLEDKDKLTSKDTNHKNVLYVKMSPWWKYKLRRSLLSALLRAGQFYSVKTVKCFEKALFSQYYLSQTRPAVEQFLKGRTGSKLKKKSIFAGWYAEFVNKQPEAVRKTLVKILPKSPVAETSTEPPVATTTIEK